MEPLEFTIATGDFDIYLLPEEARQPGTESFQNAVMAFYVDQFLSLGGSTIVGVDDEQIHVQWIPDGTASEPMEYVLTLLQSGRLKEAVPLLETLRQINPNDQDTLYNLGMALSDMGRLDEAREHLGHLVSLYPDFANGQIALAVARHRSGDTRGAIAPLEKALKLEPDNGYAHRNRGAMLASLGRHDEALVHLRKAVDLLPTDPGALFGLAQALEQLGDDGSLQEADGIYIDVIALTPDSHIGESAKTARSQIAQRTMKQRTGGGPNMAAVMYCVGAMERFDAVSVQQMQGIVMEVAFLGQKGLDSNDPSPKYQLKSIPGKQFTGLQLISMMYVGLKRMKPEADMGFDLADEYEAALQMHVLGKRKSS
jgi:Flp pilus assembly protein TadD